jgi:hypothetical protein
VSSSYFKFNHTFSSNLSGDDLKLEMSTNASDLDEVLEKFQGFLIAAGFDVEQVHASVNNSELLSCKEEERVDPWDEEYDPEKSLDYKTMYENSKKRCEMLENDYKTMEELFDTEKSLKEHYKKLYEEFDIKYNSLEIELLRERSVK